MLETDFTDSGNDSKAGSGGGWEGKEGAIDFDAVILTGCSGNVSRKPNLFASLGVISFFLSKSYNVEDGENSLLCNVDEINSYGLILVCTIGRL